MASSLAAFLDVMYKKRALEYEAALNQSKADVAGAEAIGKGISSIGGAVGSIGQGIGGVMQQTNKDQIATRLAAEQGVTLQGGGMLGGASQEFDLRQKMGQLGANEMTPYQKMQANLGMERNQIAWEAENRRYQEGLDRRSEAASRGATKAYTDTVANTDAYQNNSTANMAKLLDADTPEKFKMFQTRQISLNQGAAKAGIGEDVINQYQVPSEFVPKSQQPALELFRYQQQFSQGTTSPDIMRQKAEAAEAAGGQSYGVGPGTLNPPTMSTGVQIPAGAIPAPGFNKPVGTKTQMNGKKYVWDGNFMVPR